MITRSTAAEVIAQLLKGKGSLSTLLPQAIGKVQERDRALLQELCFGTCRWQPRLHCLVEALLDKPLRNKDMDVQALLLLGLYQLAYMRIPDHAAISSTVAAAQRLKKRWAKGLINGVLRRYQREADHLNEKLQGRPQFRLAHPGWLIQDIESAWPDQAQAIFTANNSHPPFTLRINRCQFQRDKYLALLRERGLEAAPTPFSEDGITLTKASSVESLPFFSEGAVSVQDEAAQLSAELLDLDGADRILDACCAPGGKTAHMAERLSKGHVLGLDVSEPRLARTRENLDRLKLEADLRVGDASRRDWWDGTAFDRILVDAPCSATGVIRRHPDIKLLRTREEVARLQATQRAILNNLWEMLAPGGLLVYATCSILPRENSELVGAFVAATPDAVQVEIDSDWGVAQPYGRQLFPQPGGHDGFFYAKLVKSG
ncbi:16S rRNA (cytosine(967)-C(5))-methyltransferase RsmB [Gilvimarinus sp. F26214L]|uniref:16S rRNA (cytosine(967)-C(5))-methyltransferase RsmB n=1 Tax=Gilvimarinus sp. DZF01 TaxID=3461371 RepID=UPI0040454467